MGAYIYRVTAKRVRLTDGREANVASFGYKPSSDVAFNKRMEFRSGCHASWRMAREGKLTGRVVMGGRVWEYNGGTFVDDVMANNFKPLADVFPVTQEG